MNVNCDYCHKPATLVTGDVIYPHRPDLGNKRFWHCRPCKAWVGCHANSPAHAPLGRLANAELRVAKQAAHAAFDPLWKSGRMTRLEAYRKLAECLGLDTKQTHIGRFDVELCQRVIKAAADITTQLEGTMETTAPTFASDEAIKAMALDEVQSSQIAAIGHDPGTDTLVVKFHNGGLYAYAGVPHHKFEAMKAAESAGKYLGARIKGKHEFRKVPTGETHAGAQQG